MQTSKRLCETPLLSDYPTDISTWSASAYAGFVRLIFVCGIAALSAVCGCASILGIDDGQPRDDASTLDTSKPGDSSVLDAPTDSNSPAFSPLACGSSTCNALKEGCCRSGSGTDAAALTFKCVTNASACDPKSLYIPCDRGSNCAAQDAGVVCCAIGYPATSVACSPSCFANGNTVVCSTADDGGNCPADEAGPLTCQPSSQTIVGYSICK